MFGTNYIREIAEGKCKTFILSYADTLSAVKTDLTNHSDKKMTLYSTDADVTTAFLNGDYDTDIYDNANFNSQNDSINATTGYIICKGVDNYGVSGSDYYLVYVEDQAPAEGDVRNGDVFLIVEVDVPDRWFGADGSGSKFYKMETSKVDLSNYVDKTTDQTITGVKTFSNEIDFKYQPTSTAIWQMKASGDFGWHFKRDNNFVLNFLTTQGLSTDYTFFPMNTGKDLGRSANQWKDLYLSGKIQFTINSYIAIDQYDRIYFTNQNNPKFVIDSAQCYINNNLLPLTPSTRNIGSTQNQFVNGYFSGQVYAQNTFNVINASDIVNNTLTQAQYDLITNGKPTLISGTLSSIRQNAFILAVSISGSLTQCMAIWGSGASNNIETWIITNSTLSITFGGYRYTRLREIGQINGKDVPSYPSSTGDFDLKQVSGTLTWVAEGEYVADNTLTVLGYTKMSVISVSADTTFTFATPAANSYPEYQALITNSGNVGITLTFTGVSNILCNDPDCVVTNATNSTIVVPSGVTLEINVVNGKMCAINFEVA